jgi:hypothetical protein
VLILVSKKSSQALLVGKVFRWKQQARSWRTLLGMPAQKQSAGTHGSSGCLQRRKRVRRWFIRYILDTEFIENGKTIDLVSIGIVAEDGREYYAQSVEFDPAYASYWVRDNVLAHLKVCSKSEKWVDDKSLYSWYRCEKSDCVWRQRKEIASEIAAFMNSLSFGKPQIWGWCAGYDFVALCQLFGAMMDLPQNFPHYIRDFQQILDEHGIVDEELPKQEEGLHNALADARHLKKLYGYILRNDAWQ